MMSNETEIKSRDSTIGFETRLALSSSSSRVSQHLSVYKGACQAIRPIVILSRSDSLSGQRESIQEEFFNLFLLVGFFFERETI
jgi:hypothetical protein